MQKITSLSHKEADFGGFEHFWFGWVVFSGQNAEVMPVMLLHCSFNLLKHWKIFSWSGFTLNWIHAMEYIQKGLITLLFSSLNSRLKISSITHQFSSSALGPEILNCSWRDENSDVLSFSSLAGLPASLAQIALAARALSVSHAIMASGHPWHGFTWLLWINAFTDSMWRESELHHPT